MSEGAMSRLLATKLRPPTLPPNRVARPRLARRLNEGLASGRHITLVSAPAGFGKTTCAADWAGSLEGWSVAWLSLDPSDDDPRRFFAYLVAALQQVDHRLGRDVQAVLQSGPPPPGEVVTAILADDLQAWDGHCLLVLDDFHHVQAPAILEALEKLVANPPPALHLMLLTREDPSLPLARMRANNQLTEIRAADLRFTTPDAGRFLNEVMGLGLSPTDVSLLAERTEGWIAGLQLVGLSVRHHADPSAFIAALSGSNRFILSYLSEEVLGRQPEEILGFLLQTSILDRLRGDLCDAVTGRGDGRLVLERLLRANLFLIPLDDEGQWYRYHHLFADLLANRLRQTVSEDEIRRLHCLTSDWLAQNGFLEDAVQHALEGKDYERASACVEQMARSTMEAGRVQAFGAWLRALPVSAFCTHPLLSIHRAWLDLVEGREPYAQDHASVGGPRPSPDDERLRVELMVALCHFVALTGNTGRTIRWAEGELAAAGEGDVATRTRAHSALAVACLLEGDGERARRHYDACLELALSAGNHALVAHVTMVQAMGQANYGRLWQAARYYQSMIDLGQPAGEDGTSLACQGTSGMAGIYLERNDLQAAESCLEQAMALCGQVGLVNVTIAPAVHARLRGARALQDARGDDPEASAPGWQALAGAHEAADVALAWAGVLGGAPAAVRLPALLVEDVQSILARTLLGRGEIERALEVAEALQATAESGGHAGRMMDVHLIRALAALRQNNGIVTSAALEAFEAALALAEPEGYVLYFGEQGPDLVPLLEAVAQRPAAAEELRQYARELLAAFPPGAAAPGGQGAGLAEPLTPRELEVLALIAAGDSNRAIADGLVISVSAVKKHTSNIFGKLSVSSRTQAVARARQLGILPADL